MVSEINAYILGSFDTGLLMISGKPADGASTEDIEPIIHEIIDELKTKPIEETELEKIVNKVRTTNVFSEQGILPKSIGLSMHELMGDANGINHETAKYEKITPQEIQEQAKQVLTKTNCSVLTIKATTNG